MSVFPLWTKLALTAFVAVLVPVYLTNYGWTNFLYFCDVALFCTLIAIWTEKPLWASAPAVGILLPQALWMADFLGTAVGLPITGMTAYMYDAKLSLFTRGLSFFHFWLPIVLLWQVWKLGYDRRGFWYWTVDSWALVLFSYAFLPAPPAPADNSALPVNVNFVYGLNDTAPQQWMSPRAWLALLLAALPLVIYLPTHLLLRRFAPVAKG